MDFSQPGEAWDQKPFADEYDDYLRKIVADFRNGRPLAEAVEYLLRIEREHMALGIRLGQEARAEATARSIQHFVIPSSESGKWNSSETSSPPNGRDGWDER